MTSPRSHSVMRSLLVAVTLVLTMTLASLTASPAQADSRLPSKLTWKRDVSKALAPAFPYLEKRVAQGGKLAIVLDIDNTSLASHYEWPRPVSSTLAFARRARALGVTIFFVTGRLDSNAERLRPTLRKAGYRFASVCGRDRGQRVVPSKVGCRKAIANNGFTIIASVGNRPVDFKGGYAERTFALPNYNLALY